MSKYASILVAAYVGFFAVTASAIQVVSFSTDSTKNYMFLSTAQVSSCVASGAGNINGNTTAGNPSGIDHFLLNGGTAAGYTDALVAATYSVTGATVETDGTTTIIGTWSTGTTVIDAIGFKFGTGIQLTNVLSTI